MFLWEIIYKAKHDSFILQTSIRDRTCDIARDIISIPYNKIWTEQSNAESASDGTTNGNLQK